MPRIDRITPAYLRSHTTIGNVRGDNDNACVTPWGRFWAFLMSNWCCADCFHCYRKIMNHGNEVDIFRYLAPEDLEKMAAEGWWKYPGHGSLYGAGECFLPLPGFLEEAGYELWEFYEALAIATRSQIHISGQTKYVRDYVEACLPSTRVRLYTSFLDDWYEGRYQKGILSREERIESLRKYQGPIGINFIMYDALPLRDYSAVAEYYMDIVKEVGPRDLHINIKVLSLQNDVAKRMSEVDGPWWTDHELMSHTGGKYQYPAGMQLRMVEYLGKCLKGVGVTSISACALPINVINDIIARPKVFSFISPVALALSRRTIDDAIAEEAAEEIVSRKEEKADEETKEKEKVEHSREDQGVGAPTYGGVSAPVAYALAGDKGIPADLLKYRITGVQYKVLKYLESVGGSHIGVQTLLDNSIGRHAESSEVTSLFERGLLSKDGIRDVRLQLNPNWREKIRIVSAPVNRQGIGAGSIISLRDYERFMDGEEVVNLTAPWKIEKIVQRLIDSGGTITTSKSQLIRDVFDGGTSGNLIHSIKQIEDGGIVNVGKVAYGCYKFTLIAIPPHPWGRWSWEGKDKKGEKEKDEETVDHEKDIEKNSGGETTCPPKSCAGGIPQPSLPVAYYSRIPAVERPSSVVAGKIFDLLLGIEQKGGVHRGTITPLLKSNSCYDDNYRLMFQRLLSTGVVEQKGWYRTKNSFYEICLNPDWRHMISAVCTTIDRNGGIGPGASYIMSPIDYSRIKSGTMPLMLPQIEAVESCISSVMAGQEPSVSGGVLARMGEEGIVVPVEGNSRKYTIKAIPPHPFGKWSWEE